MLYSRLHGRYHELAPHLVPMDYTNDPDCKLPLALIVSMPELKVESSLLKPAQLLLFSSVSTAHVGRQLIDAHPRSEDGIDFQPLQSSVI